eukprot:1177492-Prorocentrum_minimum.AAC.7
MLDAGSVAVFSKNSLAVFHRSRKKMLSPCWNRMLNPYLLPRDACHPRPAPPPPAPFGRAARIRGDRPRPIRSQGMDTWTILGDIHAALTRGPS